MTDMGTLAMLVMLGAGFFAGVIFGMSMTYTKIRKGTVSTKKGRYSFTASGQ